VAGKAQIGKTLTAVASGVAGDPAPAVTYQWQRRKADSPGERSVVRFRIP